MRGLLYTLSICAVIGLAFWAYGSSYETRTLERQVARLEREIGARHQELAMLRAEWAYLNRPDRLHELAEMNFEMLGLVPLSSDHFAETDQVAYPATTGPRELGFDWAARALETEIDGVIVMNHRLEEEVREPVVPPAPARDGEQLP